MFWSRLALPVDSVIQKKTQVFEKKNQMIFLEAENEFHLATKSCRNLKAITMY